MASIRRTLSPVPRPGTLLNGEAIAVASPLSKSSSSNQNYPPSGGLFSLDYALYKAQAFVLGLFSQRYSRPLERAKAKGHVWRRAIFHFFICFVVGVFVGFTPFASTRSINLVSKNQSFTFPVVNQVQIHDDLPRNSTHVLEKVALKNGTQLLNEGLANGNSTNTDVSQSLDEYLVFFKLLIIVTPTYWSPFQAYYLNRLAQTLRLVQPPLLWIVVDMTSQTVETADLLRKTGIMYRHLVCKENLTDVEDRKVFQRNAALSHIEKHRIDGIVYFADEDNVYSVDLFEHMRQIRRFGTWTVVKLRGRKNEIIVEGPICDGTSIIGWHTDESRRRFPADMAGFAFNSTVLWDPNRWQKHTLEPTRLLDTVKQRFQVSTLIEQIVEDESQMEGVPPNCSRIMVWRMNVESSYS